MSDFGIDHIENLRWLLLVAACAVVMAYGFVRKAGALRAFASTRLLGVLTPHLSSFRQYLKAGLVLSAMVFIVLALIGPRWGTYWEDVQQRQLDVMICLDVSKSMLAEDAGMSRLNRAKDDIKRLLDQLGGGSVGLVAFAGRAKLACPLTDDYNFYRLVLEDISPASAPLGGTNIGEAIGVATKGFEGGRQAQQVILLLTDGEDHGESALEEARKARERGIIVFAIGIGDDRQGALIPVEQNGQKSYLQYESQQIWSKMDPAKLQALAAAGGGEYQPSGQITPTQRTLEWIYEQRLRPLEQQANKQRQVARQYPRFHWPATIALGLLLLETLIAETRVKDRLSRPGETKAREISSGR